MEKLSGNIEVDLELINENPKLVQSATALSEEQQDYLVQLIDEQPGIIKNLLNEQLTETLISKILKANPANFSRLPKALRTAKVKQMALEVDGGVIAIFDKDEIDFEVVKYLWIKEPYILEDLDKEQYKTAKKFMKQCKKLKIQSTYNEDDSLLEIPSDDDLPDYDD